MIQKLSIFIQYWQPNLSFDFMDKYCGENIINHLCEPFDRL